MKPGYYWVLLNDEWIVARCEADGEEWSIAGSDGMFTALSFSEIGEEITRADDHPCIFPDGLKPGFAIAYHTRSADGTLRELTIEIEPDVKGSK